MLKDVKMGVNFYKELGKLEKQLVKYQNKVSEIRKQMREIKKQYSQAKKDEKKSKNLETLQAIKDIESRANFTKIDSLDELTNELKREIHAGY
ncbi:hypothetical protein [Helicobacter pylori]|uniref:hypothetical protein n=1 Tax=Helicobacter pylori TaxID=210 RepID=UPI000EB477AA|nr:hypothetical protein [Helicobacter pylori]TPH33813.1 hypothetical protein FIM84_07055 [Helicobacter pylori]